MIRILKVASRITEEEKYQEDVVFSHEEILEILYSSTEFCVHHNTIPESVTEFLT